MKNNADCRNKNNKNKVVCKIRKFCNKKNNNFLLAGKGVLALTEPTMGTAITAYETGKSLIKLGICKK